MPTYAVQFRRGTTIEHTTFIGSEGEITVNTDDSTLRLHDGETAGGFAFAFYRAIGRIVRASTRSRYDTSANDRRCVRQLFRQLDDLCLCGAGRGPLLNIV